MSTKTITIQGVQVEVAQPYAAGHTLTDAEAKALNQVRAENVRNNMAGKVKEIKGDAEEFTQEMLNAIGAAVSEYDAAYQFNMPSAGGSTRTTDPLEVEARRIARELVSNSVRSSGRKLKDIDPEALKAKVEEVAAMPQVVAEAKKTLAQKRKLVEASEITFA
jgi:hypothetical protein